ncbi:S8 family serine peptidase [Paenibacillus sp. FSL R10-2782]|uniref:S8 family serine peptidase n=1 Tax=Paenibacillus sp. FSL R10-2782 TaxID=2954661 RepID=UPI0031598CBF
MNSKIHVAIIDDGVTAEVFNTNMLYDIEMVSSLPVHFQTSTSAAQDKPLEDERQNMYMMNHGTLCAGIVQAYFPNAVISSVKILKQRKGNADQLCAALRWCVKHGVQVANISLGSTDFRDRTLLREVVNEVAAAGLIMVSAAHNGGFLTYPASFSNVIGVECDRSGNLAAGQYRYNLEAAFGGGIEFTAFARHALTDVLGGTVLCPNSNSYAAPLITAQVCMLLQSSKCIYSIELLKNELQEHSCNLVQASRLPVQRYRNPDWIRCAFVFKAGAATCTVAPYYFQIQREILISSQEAVPVIKAVLVQEHEQQRITDTLILLGHMDAVTLRQVSHLAIQYGKHVVYAGEWQCDIPTMGFFSRQLRLWHGEVGLQRELEKYKEGKSLEIPFVAIYYDGEMDIFYFLHLLKMSFVRDGYHCWVAMDQSRAVLHDMEYICFSRTVNRMEELVCCCNRIASMVHADVVILCLEACQGLDGLRKQNSPDTELELWLQTTEGSEAIRISIVSNNKLLEKRTLQGLNVEAIDALYKYIEYVLVN